MSRYSVIFAQSKMAIARASVADISPDSLVGRANSLVANAHLVQWTYDKSSEIKSRTASPVDVRQAAVFSGFEAQASWYPLLHGSILAVTAVSIWIIHSLAFRSARLRLFWQSPRCEHGWRRNRQCGRSFLCSDSDDVCHNEGKCAERGTSSRKECSCRPAVPTLKTWRLKKRTCGYPGRSKETLRAFACRFSSLCQKVHFWTLYILQLPSI